MLLVSYGVKVCLYLHLKLRLRYQILFLERHSDEQFSWTTIIEDHWTSWIPIKLYLIVDLSTHHL